MGKKKLEVINPYTGELDRTYAFQTFAEATEKVTLGKEVQEAWRDVSLPERIALVRNALKYFEENRQEIALDLTRQMGKPLNQSSNEINGLFERADYLCDAASSVLAPDKVADKPGFHRAIAHEPLGMIFTISAWNYPLLITVNSVVIALLAGNVVLLKHASLTPEVGRHFERAFGTLSKWQNLVQQVIIDHGTTGRLIEACPIDHVVFTGSVAGGRTIQSHLAKRFVTANLELGGKDGAYVAKDADIDQAAETIVDGAMYNAGQSCCGIERVYVHQDVYEAFLAKVKPLVSAYVLGDPLDEKTTMGPLASPKNADVMVLQIDDSLSKGAKVLLGGQKKTIGQGVFFEPTLVTDVDHNMKIMREENFGPILPMMKVAGDQTAIDLVNDSEYGLTAAIFTRDEKRAEMFSRKIQAGTVFMNRCDYLDPALPWTGVKNSGFGSALSPYGFFGLTRCKSIHFRLPT